MHWLVPKQRQSPPRNSRSPALPAAKISTGSGSFLNLRSTSSDTAPMSTVGTSTSALARNDRRSCGGANRRRRHALHNSFHLPVLIVPKIVPPTEKDDEIRRRKDR